MYLYINTYIHTHTHPIIKRFEYNIYLFVHVNEYMHKLLHDNPIGMSLHSDISTFGSQFCHLEKVFPWVDY